MNGLFLKTLYVFFVTVFVLTECRQYSCESVYELASNEQRNLYQRLAGTKCSVVYN